MLESVVSQGHCLQAGHRHRQIVHNAVQTTQTDATIGAALLSGIAPLPTAERERCQALLDAVINDSKEHQMKSIKEHAWGLDSDDKPTGDAVIVAVRPNDDAKTHVDPWEGFQWK